MVREDHQVAQVAVAVADVVDEQRLPGEPEIGEQRQGGALLGDHLDDQLGQSRTDRLHQRVPGQLPAQPAPAAVRRDHQPHLADVVGPPRQRPDGDVAGHLGAAVDRHPAAAGARPARPRPHRLRVVDLLADEGQVALGQPVEEPQQCVAALRSELLDRHVTPPRSAAAAQRVAAPAHEVDDRRHRRPGSRAPDDEPHVAGVQAELVLVRRPDEVDQRRRRVRRARCGRGWPAR